MAAPEGRRKADLKVVILGLSDVGKTALISRYIDGKFSSQCEQTIGASFSLKQWGPFNVAIWDTAGSERFMGLSSFYCRSAGAAILAFDLRDMESFEALSSRFVPLLQSANDDCLCVVVGTKCDLLPTAAFSNSSSPSSIDTPDSGLHFYTHAKSAEPVDIDLMSSIDYSESLNNFTRVPVHYGLQLARNLNKSHHFDNEVPYFETSSLSNKNVDAVFEYIFRTVLPLDKADEIKAKRSGSIVDLETPKKQSETSKKGTPKKTKCC